jgi:beta-glucosidase
MAAARSPISLDGYTPMLYIRDDVSSVPRPVLELRDFHRVTLAPGEARTLTFELPPDALAFWDIDMRWRVEPGNFTISCGPSSAALKSAKLTVSEASGSQPN